MADFIRVEGKTVEDALTEATVILGTTSEMIDFEVIEKGSSGFLGIGSKPAIIKARKKMTLVDKAIEFLENVFEKMGIVVNIQGSMNEEEKTIDINLTGSDMGNLIGKRGQTLDSLQYLTSLVINKEMDDYIRVKLDTENYRERRKETLENLAKNISMKVEGGRMLGIVGRSGAGKTTIVNLISRLYDPQEGTVTLDGVNLKDLSFKTLRGNVAMVSQETYMFMGTVAETPDGAVPTFLLQLDNPTH